MARSKKIYFEEENQKVRWTQSSSDGFKYDYKFIGVASEAEFDLLMELLWFMYEDDEISYKCKSLITKYKCVSKKRDAAIKKLKCETRTLEDYGYIKNIESHFKKYKEFAISLGCNSKEGISNIDECVARYLPSVIGSGPMSISDLALIKNDWSAMNEIQKAIEEMSRQQNQSQNEPTEEEKQQALAQENSSGQVTWKYTPGGIGYWDYGNGFGWAPPNPKRDKIIQGLLVSQRTKNFLLTGPKGKTVFVPR